MAADSLQETKALYTELADVLGCKQGTMKKDILRTAILRLRNENQSLSMALDVIDSQGSQIQRLTAQLASYNRPFKV
jgi:hypothetical protein